MDIEMISGRASRDREWSAAGAIFVMPFTDKQQAARSARHLASRAAADGLLLAVHDSARNGFIAVANRIFAQTRSPYFGYVAQDAFAGRYWLRIALFSFEIPDIHLVAFNDGKWFGKLASFGLARRRWAEEIYGGPLFFPQYNRHYADAELSVIAAEQNALAYSENSVLVEVDWEKDTRKVDAADRELFRKRARRGFDGRVKSKTLKKRFS